MSTDSSQPNDNCVEVRCGSDAPGPMVEVRDSKNRDGGTLSMPFVTWVAIIAAVKRI